MASLKMEGTINEGVLNSTDYCAMPTAHNHNHGGTFEN